jgi:hypothetical protein
VLLLFRVWVRLVVGWPVWCLGGFLAVIGLTGASHRSDRCGSVDSRFGFSAAFLWSEGGVLVPRSSGTPVATWA